jgi:general secretion pathway protein H
MIRPPRAQDGFTLLETVCVVAIIAMLAAVLLPIMPRETSRPRLEAYAVETASLLNADRTTAIRRRMAIATQVDAASRSIRSGSSSHVVQIPDDVSIDAVLPQRCNDAPAYHTISFFATGMSCGGTIALSRPGAGYEIRVNWLTGGIEIVPRRVL